MRHRLKEESVKSACNPGRARFPVGGHLVLHAPCQRPKTIGPCAQVILPDSRTCNLIGPMTGRHLFHGSLGFCVLRSPCCGATSRHRHILHVSIPLPVCTYMLHGLAEPSHGRDWGGTLAQYALLLAVRVRADTPPVAGGCRQRARRRSPHRGFLSCITAQPMYMIRDGDGGCVLRIIGAVSPELHMYCLPFLQLTCTVLFSRSWCYSNPEATERSDSGLARGTIDNLINGWEGSTYMGC